MSRADTAVDPRDPHGHKVRPPFFFFFFTLVAGPRRSLSLKLSHKVRCLSSPLSRSLSLSPSLPPSLPLSLSFPVPAPLRFLPRAPQPPPALLSPEATQGHILSQSPTDATSSR